LTNQSDRQASVRAITGTELTYEGDWHSLFDSIGLDGGTFNGRLLEYLNKKLGVTYTNLPSAMAAFAIDQGVSCWDELGTFDATA